MYSLDLDNADKNIHRDGIFIYIWVSKVYISHLYVEWPGGLMTKTHRRVYICVHRQKQTIDFVQITLFSFVVLCTTEWRWPGPRISISQGLLQKR